MWVIYGANIVEYAQAFSEKEDKPCQIVKDFCGSLKVFELPMTARTI